MIRRAAMLWGGTVLAAWLAGCAAFDKPMRATLYDLGPPPAAVADPSSGQQSALVLADIQAPNALDGTAVHYRLGYADAHQLRSYAQARWSAPLPQLVRQRLREQLSRDRVVLDQEASAALARVTGTAPPLLRIDLEEFSQQFDSASESWGVLRLRATLMDATPSGEKRLVQRSFVVRRRASTPDAPGGVRALAAATDAVAEEIGQWLAQQGQRR